MALRLIQSPFGARRSVVMRTVICSALCSGRALQVLTSSHLLGGEDGSLHVGAVERTRTSTPCGANPSSYCVYQCRHDRTIRQLSKPDLLANPGGANKRFTTTRPCPPASPAYVLGSVLPTAGRGDPTQL